MSRDESFAAKSYLGMFFSASNLKRGWNLLSLDEKVSGSVSFAREKVTSLKCEVTNWNRLECVFFGDLVLISGYLMSDFKGKIERDTLVALYLKSLNQSRLSIKFLGLKPIAGWCLKIFHFLMKT